MTAANKSDWLQVIFDTEDHICMTVPPNGLVSTQVYPLAEANLANQYICINALDGAKDNEPTEEWHDIKRPRRAVANVTKFRSLLVEFDERELLDQVDYVQAIEMPYSLLTFSGGKSFHFLICLVEPCNSRKEYTQLVERVYAAVGGKPAGLDTSTKDASRLSRTPNAIRQAKGDQGVWHPTEAVQALVDVQARVPNQKLEDWLTSRGFSKKAADERVAAIKKVREAKEANKLPRWRQAISGSTLNFLMSGGERGQWNISCFKAACDLVRCGYTEEEVWTKMEQAPGFDDHKDAVSTTRSAIKRAEYDMETTEQ